MAMLKVHNVDGGGWCVTKNGRRKEKERERQREREREREKGSIFRDGVRMGQLWLSQLRVHTHYFNVGSNACY